MLAVRSFCACMGLFGTFLFSLGGVAFYFELPLYAVRPGVVYGALIIGALLVVGAHVGFRLSEPPKRPYW